MSAQKCMHLNTAVQYFITSYLADILNYGTKKK